MTTEYVVIDLSYRVAYLVDDQGVAQLAASETTRSTVGPTLADWGYRFAPNSAWEVTDILNAIDAMRRPVERMESVSG